MDPTDDSNDHGKYILEAKINAKTISVLLKAIHFQENVICIADSAGMKFTVEEAKCFQANSFVKAEVFQSYQIDTEETIIFRVHLTAFVECLAIFCGGGIPRNETTVGSIPVLRLCYSGYGSPLQLLLEEDGVLTDCCLRTREPGEILDFNFSTSKMLSKAIFRSEPLRDVFAELDFSNDYLEFTFKKDPMCLQLSTSGNSGTCRLNIPNHSDFTEMFDCAHPVTSRYKMQLLKPTMKALALSQKVSIRIDDRKVLCLQHLIRVEEDETCFIEYFCLPDVDEDIPGV